MASPGPRMRNPGSDGSGSEDGYASDSDHLAPSPHRSAGRIPAPLFDSDEESSPLQRARTATSPQSPDPAAAPRQRRRAAAVPAGIADPEGFTWIAAEDLLQNDKSADCKYFYGSNKVKGTFKCRLCK